MVGHIHVIKLLMFCLLLHRIIATSPIVIKGITDDVLALSEDENILAVFNCEVVTDEEDGLHIGISYIPICGDTEWMLVDEVIEFDEANSEILPDDAVHYSWKPAYHGMEEEPRKSKQPSIKLVSEFDEANSETLPDDAVYWSKPYASYSWNSAYHGMEEEPRKSKQPSIMLVLKVISAALLINAISLFLIVSLCYKTFWYHPTSKNQIPSYINRCRRRRNQTPASHQLQTHGLFPEGLPFDQMVIQATTVPQLLKAFLLLMMYMAALLAVTVSSLALPAECNGKCLKGSSKKKRQVHDQDCPPISCLVVPTDTAESQMTANIPDGDSSMTKYANNHYCDSYILRSRIVEALLRLVDGCA